MRLKSLLLILLLSMSIPLEAQGCDLPPRLTPGETGYVTPTENPRAVRVRENPTTDAPIIGMLEEGTIFTVTEEASVCAGGIVWWNVTDGTVTGWIAEGVDQDYFVEPSPTDTPEQVDISGLAPVIPVTAAPTLANSYAKWNWPPSYTFDLTIPDPLTIELPPAYQGKMPALPVDLSQVGYLDDAELSPEQLEVLAANGFVVVPGNAKEFTHALWNDPETGRSNFITTDMMLHNLYVIYRYTLMYLEAGIFFEQIASFLSNGYLAAEAQMVELEGTPLEDAARSAAVYYAVGLMLAADMDDMENFDAAMMFNRVTFASEYLGEIDPEIKALAQPIVDAAKAAEGSLPVLADYEENFTLYAPRSYYADEGIYEAYFQTITWLGRVNFAASSEQDTLAALLVLRALQNGGAQESWAGMSDTLEFLIGPTTNLNPNDYLPIAHEIFGENLSLEALQDETKQAEFQAAIATLPAPTINSIALPVETSAEDMREAGRGFRLMGSRYTLDAYFLQKVMHPDLPNRPLPSGLDLAAAFGSDSAYQLSDGVSYEGYQAMINQLRGDVNAIEPDNWMETAYGGWLWALQPLVVRDPLIEPPLMKTEAWRRKDLTTMLSSWTELKNATAAYVTPPLGLGGGGEDYDLTTYTYVEPNPLVFARIAILSKQLADGLEARGLTNGVMGTVISEANTHASMSGLAAAMAELELKGEPIPEDWLYFFQEYFANFYVNIFVSLSQFDSDPPRNIALTALAASSPAGNLQVATGLADYIYVVTDRPEGLQLTRGGVYSFYEFTDAPILNDKAWRDQIDAGNVPPRPDWIEMYYVP